MSGNDSDIGKLRWRCRRGTKELDLLLNRFLDHEHADLDAEQKSRFDDLLEMADPQLQAWFSGAEQPEDAAMKILVQRILSADPA